MLTKLRSRLLNRERGSGELFAVLIFTPMALFLLFMLINFSTYFEAKASIQQAAQSGARLVALYGGNTGTAALNPSGVSAEQTVSNIIAPGGKCSYSACQPGHPPVVACSPHGLVSQVGQVVTCTITYWYLPVATSDPYGFTNALVQKFTVTGSYISETRYQ